jgi:alcohol dehydrogenase class IV
MPQDFFQFYCPTKIISCAGIAREFLKNAGVSVAGLFTEVPANSEVKAVKRCAEEGAKKDVDGVIAIGGGSVIDTAKGATILLTHGGDLVKDYSGAETLPGALKPLVAIPTTAGTGSEVTHAAVILDEESHTKLSFVDRHLAPALAVLDPELTVGLPPKLTAATAMDALTHAIESFTSIQANPFSEAMASEAIPLIRKNLLKAVLHGEDIDARSNLLIAAALAGIAFDHAMVGVVHGMSHATGGIVGVHHGTANSIFLPWGMEYNLSVCADKYAQIAGLLGVKTAGLTDEAAARKAIEAVIRLREELNQACGLPTRLKDAGVREDQLEAIAEGAVNDGTSFYNPRDVVKEEVLEAVRKAY